MRESLGTIMRDVVITSDFFSGLIMLFELPIKIGARVEIAGAIGECVRSRRARLNFDIWRNGQRRARRFRTASRYGVVIKRSCETALTCRERRSSREPNARVSFPGVTSFRQMRKEYRSENGPNLYHDADTQLAVLETAPRDRDSIAGLV